MLGHDLQINTQRITKYIFHTIKASSEEYRDVWSIFSWWCLNCAYHYQGKGFAKIGSRCGDPLNYVPKYKSGKSELLHFFNCVTPYVLSKKILKNKLIYSETFLPSYKKRIAKFTIYYWATRETLRFSYIHGYIPSSVVRQSFCKFSWKQLQ